MPRLGGVATEGRGDRMASIAPVVVNVRLFAGLRERAGTDRLEVELPDGALVKDLLAAMAGTARGELRPGGGRGGARVRGAPHPGVREGAGAGPCGRRGGARAAREWRRRPRPARARHR